MEGPQGGKGTEDEERKGRRRGLGENEGGRWRKRMNMEAEEWKCS